MAAPGRADSTAADAADLATRLGARLRRIEAVGWGDAVATHRLELDDGRTVAARAITGAAALATAERQAAVLARLLESGLPAPEPTVVPMTSQVWLLTPWVEGETGATWLDTPERARSLARGAGRIARDLRRVDPGGLGLEEAGATGPGSAAQARDWLRSARPQVDRTTAAVEDAIRWLDAAVWSPSFVHGDLAPVNLIVDPDGAIVALLDVERATVGSPIADAAWWGWVVRHHHPEAWAASGEGFGRAAGLDPGIDGTDGRAVAALQLVGLLRAVAEAQDDTTRARWLARLDGAVGWTAGGDCQAT
jgi:aminoglycoside phosphotransferase (APT) family kinase protein